MINGILIAIFIGALYLGSNLIMFNLGKIVGHNEANLDEMIERAKNDKIRT